MRAPASARKVVCAMKTIVQKYGGTSLGSVELIQRVAGKVAAARERGWPMMKFVANPKTAAKTAAKATRRARRGRR
jgi:aspartokinase